MQNDEIQTVNILAKADQKIKNYSNKLLYKVRVFNKFDSKKIETYLSFILDKTQFYVEFYGYISSNSKIQDKLENATSVNELTKLIADNKANIFEILLTKPWHQVVEIETVKKKQGE